MPKSWRRPDFMQASAPMSGELPGWRRNEHHGMTQGTWYGQISVVCPEHSSDEVFCLGIVAKNNDFI
jgi:hypothetical protein